MSKLNKYERVNNVFNLIREDGSVSMTKEQLVEKYELWLDFDYKDWLIILEKIKNEPLKLYGFITFAYTILGIEMIHEFLKLKGVTKKVVEYVDSGKRFPIHSISEQDINYYYENRRVIEEVNKSLSLLKNQGATAIEEYKVRSRRIVDNVINKYIRTIKRTEITLITPNELTDKEYLVKQRRVNNS